MNKIITVLFVLIALSSCLNQEKELKVLQMNVWQEGTMVEGGFDAIIEEITFHKPDIILFSEVRNYNDIDFVGKVKDRLEKNGLNYFGQTEKSVDVATLSTYPITEQTVVGRDIHPGAGVLKTSILIETQKIVAYSAHLDYKNYACYLPRGYSGVTWEKLDAPITDPAQVEAANKLSLRDEAIQGVIADAKKEPIETVIILGGDFNEPSHLDWTAQTKDLYDHNGAIIRWECSMLLEKNGFIDSYRAIYPNPTTHPGFTFPADNRSVEVEKLTWAPTVDERDRIDFIYYKPNAIISLKKTAIIGPASDIINSERVAVNTADNIVEPQNIWPTDHKAMLSTFSIKMK